MGLKSRMFVHTFLFVFGGRKEEVKHGGHLDQRPKPVLSFILKFSHNSNVFLQTQKKSRPIVSSSSSAAAFVASYRKSLSLVVFCAYSSSSVVPLVFRTVFLLLPDHKNIFYSIYPTACETFHSNFPLIISGLSYWEPVHETERVYWNSCKTTSVFE